MTVGETLLKITDYPFVYSLTLIIVGFNGIDPISKDAYPYLAAAGFIGTFIAILDPFGKLIKYSIMYLQKLSIWIYGNSENESWSSLQSAYHTRPIEIEKDKLVSMFYFLIVVSVVNGLLNSTTSFNQHFAFIINLNPHCNADCQKTFSTLILLTIQGVIIFVMGWNGKKLTKKVTVVSTYLSSINSPKVQAQSIENISQFIDSGDWKTAEFWQTKIREDVKYNKGQKDLILKSIEKIYRPLYRESLLITDVNNRVATGESYSQFVTQTWDTIRNNSDFVIMDDTIRKEVISLYDKIYEYNHWLSTIRRKIDGIILKRASEEFGEQINRIEYFRRSDSGVQDPNLIESALLNMHPSQYQGTGQTSRFNINYVRKDNGNQENRQYSSDDAFAHFEHMWALVLSDVNSDSVMIKIKDLFSAIRSENLMLNKKYFEKISEEANL